MYFEINITQFTCARHETPPFTTFKCRSRATLYVCGYFGACGALVIGTRSVMISESPFWREMRAQMRVHVD